MRRFSHFLFENFDADEQWDNPLNPRAFMNDQADEVLSYVAQIPAGTCKNQDLLSRCGIDPVQKLLDGGILRKQGDRMFFDTPVFLKEDAAILQNAMGASAEKLSNQLEGSLPKIHDICRQLHNGFPEELNLYHILCGMVFDGSFFDILERNGAVATSRQHISGLDYISVIYERCPELDTYADSLLCSYNRFANEQCSLQSFGDANGNRYDFYRFFRLLEGGSLPENFRKGELLLTEFGKSKREFLNAVMELLVHGRCTPQVMMLLEEFGYAEAGKLCVPVYTEKDKQIICEIEKIINEKMSEAFTEELKKLSSKMNITANQHGVAPEEVANELYHILFGSVNEALIRKGVVVQPPDIPGQGRFLRCIQVGF